MKSWKRLHAPLAATLQRSDQQNVVEQNYGSYPP